MNVQLLNGYKNEAITELAAAICVGKLDEPTKKGMEVAINSRHYSILEHLPLTFLIEDVSRALSHQLVRHRIASYSQQSQRYVKLDTNEEWYVTPKTVGFIHSASEKYKQHMRNTATLYDELLQSGVPKEDARFILPNACHTSILVTMNARSFIEQAEHRLCSKAQWEIRECFSLMRLSIKDLYPNVYKLAQPPCATNKCLEVKPCNNPFKDV